MVGTLAFADTVQSITINTQQLPVTTITVKRPILNFYSTVFLKDYASEESVKYGLTDAQHTILMATISCESGWNIHPKPNHISWGIVEFTPATWHDFGHGDIMNPITQIDTMIKMWSNGLENRWDCYRLGLYKKYL
jgi:hypothetical protein